MNLFAYERLKQRKSVESVIQRKLEHKDLHARLPGFKLSSNITGSATVTYAEGITVPGIVWQDLTEDELASIDLIMNEWTRERHKVLPLPFFPLEHKMYVIDAWVYVQPIISV